MQQKCVSLADVVLRLGHVIKRGIHTLILARAVLIHQALLAVTELQEQYLRYVVAGRLLVLVINVQLVIQVHLIIAMFIALVMVIAVQMVHINLAIRYVAVVGVVQVVLLHLLLQVRQEGQQIHAMMILVPMVVIVIEIVIMVVRYTIRVADVKHVIELRAQVLCVHHLEEPIVVDLVV